MLKQMIPTESSQDKINVGRKGVGWINLARDVQTFKDQDI